LFDVFDGAKDPHDEPDREAKAGHENENDSGQQFFAPFTRQTREQNLAHRFGEIGCDGSVIPV
jgi:hypothetical protein